MWISSGWGVPTLLDPCLWNRDAPKQFHHSNAIKFNSERWQRNNSQFLMSGLSHSRAEIIFSSDFVELLWSLAIFHTHSTGVKCDFSIDKSNFESLKSERDTFQFPQFTIFQFDNKLIACAICKAHYHKCFDGSDYVPLWFLIHFCCDCRNHGKIPSCQRPGNNVLGSEIIVGMLMNFRWSVTLCESVGAICMCTSARLMIMRSIYWQSHVNRNFHIHVVSHRNNHFATTHSELSPREQSITMESISGHFFHSLSLCHRICSVPVLWSVHFNPVSRGLIHKNAFTF